MKTAMRAKDAPRLSAIRLLLAAIKQREVDERKDLTDADVVAVIEKMIKQRRDSIEQFTKGGRQDLVDVEQFEIVVLQGYMPKALSDGGDRCGDRRRHRKPAAPKVMADMGKVMAVLKPQLAGRPTWAKSRRWSRPSSRHRRRRAACCADSVVQRIKVKPPPRDGFCFPGNPWKVTYNSSKAARRCSGAVPDPAGREPTARRSRRNDSAVLHSGPSQPGRHRGRGRVLRARSSAPASNYAARCPFHSEKSPSFTVSQTKQFYHCFGCGAHGTAISFLMEYQGMGFVDAVKDLAGRVGMQVPEQAPDPRRQGEGRGGGRPDRGHCSRPRSTTRPQLKSSDRAMAYLRTAG